MPNMVELVKKAALDAVEASKPVQVLYGVVTSSSPLKIQVDQKAIYTEKMLILTRNVTNYSVTATNSQIGTVTLTLNNALKTGERVLLVRVQGGKKFAVLDRVKS